MREEDIYALINKVMKTRQLRSEYIKENDVCIDIPGQGTFTCSDCDHTWKSFFSWITISLKEKKIYKRWLMKCVHCDKKCEPMFEVVVIEKMVDEAITIYKGDKFLTNVTDIGYNGFRKRKVPHLSLLCEKCKWGKENCWTNWRRSAYRK